MGSSMKTSLHIDRAAWPFVGIAAAITFGLSFAAPWLGVLGAVLTLCVALFFRDPRRVTPNRAGLIVSPADGIVCKIDSAPPPPELGMGEAPMSRVCVFMSVFDVHVNRAPIEGVIVESVHKPGTFVNASFDKASEDNERNSLRIRMDDGRDLACVQIAGLIARRIRCDVSLGQRVKTGQRIGLIRFGSRLDVYLPSGAIPLVVLGQRMVAGESVLADLTSEEPMRGGEVR